MHLVIWNFVGEHASITPTFWCLAKSLLKMHMCNFTLSLAANVKEFLLCKNKEFWKHKWQKVHVAESSSVSL